MSQIFKSSASGPVPPQVPITFQEDTGSAQSVANVINIFGLDSTTNNDNGITTTGSGNTVTILLTNRATGSVSTSDATPTTIITFPLGSTAGVYYFNGDLAAYDLTDVAGGAYSFTSGARTSGVAGADLGTEFKDVLEDAAMLTADYDVSVSGNNLIISVTGVAGKSINWNCYLTYRFVS